MCAGNQHQLSHLLPLHSLETKEWWNNKSKGKKPGTKHAKKKHGTKKHGTKKHG